MGNDTRNLMAFARALDRSDRLLKLIAIANRRAEASWETRLNGRLPYENFCAAWERCSRLMAASRRADEESRTARQKLLG